MNRIKHFAIILSRCLLKIIYILPINDRKIFFTSYEGKQFSCNPKYVFLRLADNSNIKLIYEYNKTNSVPDELKRSNVSIVKHNSIKYFVELLTSKVIVTNSGITAKIPLRIEQVMINTWHAGGAYKKVGKDIRSEVNGSDAFFIDIATKQTSYFLTSSKGFSNGTAKAIDMPECKLLRCGMPRNDLIVVPNESYNVAINEKVKTALNIAHDAHFVIYAPTFRKNDTSDSFEPISEKSVVEALQTRFGGEWVFVYRGHYHGTDNNHFCIDATYYPDMQELLIASDALITDYSSTVWDYSFTNKPGFLYTPDLSEYKSERDFYCPISEWPYPISEDNASLVNNILAFDQSRQKKMNEAHHKQLGSYEDGHGTDTVVQLVAASMKMKV